MSGTERSVAGAAAAGPHAPTAAPTHTVTASGSIAAATSNTVAAAAGLPLVQLLQQSLSADPNILRMTQEALDTKAAAEDFPKELLVLLVNADTPLPAKQAGAIYFKNFIRRSWDVDPQQGGISLANRTLIKQHLLSLLLSPGATKSVQLQLADACTRIAATDMPLDWPSLLPELMQQHLLPSLSTQQQLLQQLVLQQQCSGGRLVQQEEEAAKQEIQQRTLQKEIAVLEMLHAVLKKYRSAFRSNDVLLELREILPVVQQPLLQAFLLALQHLQMLRTHAGGAEAAAATAAGTATTAGGEISNAPGATVAFIQQLQQTKHNLYEILLLCCKTFLSLNTVDIPEFFEDHMQDFFGGFIKLLQVDILTHKASSPHQQQPEDDDNTADVEDKLRTQICINMKLYADKYQEEFQPFVMACVQAVWQMMTHIDKRQKFDFTAAAAMEFLSSAASTAWQQTEGAPAGTTEVTSGDPFSNLQLLQEICKNIILPNVQLRDCDVEQMDDTPLEFARRELEGGEQHTRRSAALDLVKSLMKLREELITALLLQAVQSLSSQAAAAKAATANISREKENAGDDDGGGNILSATATAGATATIGSGTCTRATVGSGGKDLMKKHDVEEKEEVEKEKEEKLLDACTFLVLAVGVKGSTRVRGVHAVNKNVDTQQFFQSLLLKELQNPNIEKRYIVRVAGMKVIAAFRNVFDIQLLQGVLPLLVMHLSAKRVVVHTFAAYAIERLLSARQNGQPRINKTVAAPLLKQALEVLLQQLQGNCQSNSSSNGGGSGGSSENEFLLKCLLRIFSYLREDAIAAVLPSLRVILDNIKKISSNPSNPSFSHYLFECLATLVKLSSFSPNNINVENATTVICNNNNIRTALERDIIPVLSIILQQTIHEFVPYCFQILGLLLETAAAEEKGMLPATAALYIELYEHLLSPSFWTAAQGNVPALVKLLCCYFRRQQLFPDMIRNSMQQLLQRFQYCLYHKKLTAAAFELLNSIFRLLPFSFYSSLFRMLLTVLLRRVHELNKKLSICKEVALSLMLFQCKCEDPAVLVNTLEAIQAGLWQQVLSFILLPAITASAAAPLHHKKVLILGLSRVTTCAAVASNKALLSPTLEALAALIARKEEDERDVHRTRASVKLAAAEEEESIAGYDPITAAEFDLYYARLAAADMHHSKDMVENVTDIQHSVQMCLSPLKADIEELARGGAQVRPLLAVLLAV